MRIGIPSETKTLEGRVALVPEAAGDLVNRGHEVWVQKGAGLKSGFSDEAYTRLGVKIAPDAAALYEKGELIVKVKEPIEGDLALLRKDHLLFCYLHLAPLPELVVAVQRLLLLLRRINSRGRIDIERQAREWACHVGRKRRGMHVESGIIECGKRRNGRMGHGPLRPQMSPMLTIR